MVQVANPGWKSALVFALITLISFSAKANGCRLFRFDALQAPLTKVIHGNGPRHRVRDHSSEFPIDFGQELSDRWQTNTIEIDLVASQVVIIENAKRNEFYSPLETFARKRIEEYATSRGISFEDALHSIRILRLRRRGTASNLNRAPHTDNHFRGTHVLAQLFGTGTFSCDPTIDCKRDGTCPRARGS